MTKRVLIVCLGNICRSPMAEGVLRGMAAEAGLDLQIDSAGTGNWHSGDAPYPPAIKAAAARGYDISGQRARQVQRGDFDRFDLILAMDNSNMAKLQQLRPTPSRADLALFLDHAPDTDRGEVPDPYFTGDFEEALDLIETAAAGLIASLKR